MKLVCGRAACRDAFATGGGEFLRAARFQQDCNETQVGVWQPRFWLKQMRQWHWISAAICLIGMLLFAVTGITLIVLEDRVQTCDPLGLRYAAS